jgi:hypothetical protein
MHEGYACESKAHEARDDRPDAEGVNTQNQAHSKSESPIGAVGFAYSA